MGRVLHFAYVLKTLLQLRAYRLLSALISNEGTRAAGPGAPSVRAVEFEALALDLDLLEHGVSPNIRCSDDDQERRSYFFPPGCTFSHIRSEEHTSELQSHS